MLWAVLALSLSYCREGKNPALNPASRGAAVVPFMVPKVPDLQDGGDPSEDPETCISAPCSDGRW